MAKYVILGRFQSAMDFAQTKKRLDKVRKALAAVNGKLEAVHYTMGPYDFVDIIEAPDNQAMAAYLTWYAKLGVAETTTMPAFSADEMQQAAGRIK